MVIHVAQQMAAIKRVKVEVVIKANRENVREVYKI